MKRVLTASLVFTSFIWFSACDSGTTNEQETTTSTETSETTASDTTLTDNSRELMAFAARNNMLQVELGKLATEKGMTDDVKQQGQQLMTWYEAKQKELAQLAREHNITLPQQPEEAERKDLDELRNTKPAEFDRTYWKTVANMQDNALDKYDSNLKDVTEANTHPFNLWARSTMKELQAQRDKTAALRTQLKMD
ncbi:DUF4142 domain-containing protein [Pontibacter arcticus]|uniref:DUF4142 domain-containing protein n=1 Tax=Pontibacter arcticus TaxID=2080288 RepID=A0A364RDB6_9BACT|nr:DUF4142 domain-containing protein [Pontibacter arcticus]RAU82264.1 hypothetical protein DP923_10755 [Pontibacter arcticus]